MSEAENGDQEIYLNDNIPSRQEVKHQCRRPVVPITESCIKAIGGNIKNKKNLLRTAEHVPKL